MSQVLKLPPQSSISACAAAFYNLNPGILVPEVWITEKKPDHDYSQKQYATLISQFRGTMVDEILQKWC